MPRVRKKEAPRSAYRPCDVPGCPESAEYRAPKERSVHTDYHWFCLDHVRDYNKHWDYFEGMGQEEIESFMKDAVTGHRPTWYLGGNGDIGPEKLEAAFGRFMGMEMHFRDVRPPIDRKDEKALKELELEHPADRPAIKREYKRLVKALHPDLNPGDHEAEERFKRVTAAYRQLMASYAVDESASAR